MSKYQHYLDRVNSGGTTPTERTTSRTFSQVEKAFMNSRTLSEIFINRSNEIVHSIVSRVKTEGNFSKRRFLLKPKSKVELGYYVSYKDNHYLATEIIADEFFPELVCELCNAEFPLLLGKNKVITGKDDFGRPIESIVPILENIPCVLTTKTYSIIDNAPISLPEGSLNIKIPYNPQHPVGVNYEINIRNSTYKVTTISYENVVNEVGFIDIRLQVET